MKSKLFLTTLAACAALALSARAELKTAAVFGDNMVLQQQMPVPVWGWADPGSKVKVSFAGQTRTAKAGADGKWLVRLGKLKASFVPQSLVVEAKELIMANAHTEAFAPPINLYKFPNPTKTFTNILVGEVWLASGQSNMEKPIGEQRGQKPTFNAEAELAAANYPNIRLFKIEKELSAKPLSDLRTFQGWVGCSSNALNTTSFSAAAYFFGQMLHTNLNVPIGLVESAWGGTRIEPWTPPAGFENVASQKKFADQPDLINIKPVNTQPSAIYNAMIAPIAGFALRGAIWYQGESNLMGTNANNDYREYADKMAALVGGWRATWDEGDFPFYFVQIAPFKYHGGKQARVNSPEMLPEFWTLQSKAAREIKNTGMVVTTDLVDDVKDIHPRNKKDVGRRLALLALDETYDKEVASESPVFERVKFKSGKAIVKFDEAEGGLKSRDGQPLTWFEIAGADGKFVPATAKIIGEETVEVSSPEVKAPKAVRFAWSEIAQPNLCNGAGLPAEPFNTTMPVK